MDVGGWSELSLDVRCMGRVHSSEVHDGNFAIPTNDNTTINTRMCNLSWLFSLTRYQLTIIY